MPVVHQGQMPDPHPGSYWSILVWRDIDHSLHSAASVTTKHNNEFGKERKRINSLVP